MLKLNQEAVRSCGISAFATLVDVLGLVIYFSVAALILRGTLL